MGHKDHMDSSETIYGVPLKFVSLVSLTLQNTGAVLIMRESLAFGLKTVADA